MILPGGVGARGCGCQRIRTLRALQPGRQRCAQNALHLRPAEAYHYPSGETDATGRRQVCARSIPHNAHGRSCIARTKRVPEGIDEISPITHGREYAERKNLLLVFSLCVFWRIGTRPCERYSGSRSHANDIPRPGCGQKLSCCRARAAPGYHCAARQPGAG